MRRRDAVQLWLENGAALDEFRRDLAGVRDLERTLGRLAGGSGNGRDLVSLRQALEKIPALKALLQPLAGGPPPAPPDALRELPMEARRRRGEQQPAVVARGIERADGRGARFGGVDRRAPLWTSRRWR